MSVLLALGVYDACQEYASYSSESDIPIIELQP